MNEARRSSRSISEWSPVERAAAEWVARLRHGLSAAEQAALDRWLAEHSSHAGMFAEMQETLRLLGQLRDPALAPESAPCTTFAPSEPCEPGRRNGRLLQLIPAAFAAAAALVVGIVTWQWWSAAESYAHSTATEVGGLRTLDLPDGSIVHLNTDSVLDVIFSPSERGVRLSRGEAFFTVARDRRRPFRVVAGAISVCAIGTAFNVRYREDAVEVLVKQGRVSVDPAEPSTSSAGPHPVRDPSPPRSPDRRLLVAGQRAVISNGFDLTAPVVIAAVEAHQIESTLAWQARRLEFSDTPLAEVVVEFNRYNRHRLVIADPALGAIAFGGAFRSDGYESLVEVLEQTFNVVAERREGATILRLGL